MQPLEDDIPPVFRFEVLWILPNFCNKDCSFT